VHVITGIARCSESRPGVCCSANKEIYEKWSQGLSSAHDLITASYWEGASEGPGNIAYVAVLPIVVVPDGRLWAVQYNADGLQTGEPVTMERCSYFVNTAYRMSSQGPTLNLSHVEFVTLTGLEAFVSTMLGQSTMESIFPVKPLESAMEELTAGHYYG